MEPVIGYLLSVKVESARLEKDSGNAEFVRSSLMKIVLLKLDRMDIGFARVVGSVLVILHDSCESGLGWNIARPRT